MTLFIDQTLRHCSRCLSSLEDPASREAGIGPICRQKDNHLYAKTIQANLPAASALILGTSEFDLPVETQDSWKQFKAEYLRKVRKAERQSDLIFNGVDFRDLVRKLDFLLSYRITPKIKDRIVLIVRYLGYPGLASVLAQEASTSPAKVWIDESRIYLSGASCKTGWVAMRPILGVIRPRFRGDKTPYSAPLSQLEAFMTVVMTHWPMYEKTF